MVIVNTSGAGGSTGTRAVKDAESDGYKLLFFHSAALVSMLTGTMDFDIFKEFKILTLTSSDQTEALVVSGDSPYKTSADLISAAKANPGKLSCAIEIGSYGHLNTLIYEDLAGIDLKVVDGGSTAEKLPGLLGGKFDLMTVHLGAINDYIISGKMRSIGVLAEERLPKWSNIPTLKEQGIDLVFEKYCFLAANKNTPDDVCKIIQDAAIRALKNPEYIKKAKENYAVDINAISGEESTKKLKAQFDLFSKYKDLLNKK